MKVFINESQDKQFKKEGYVVLPLIWQNEVDVLLKEFAEQIQQFEQPFHTSHFSEDVNYKQKVHDTICKVVAPFTKAVLNNFVPVFGNFMIKRGGGNNYMPLHPDWTYVDESKFASVSVWIPLVDTSLDNGCLGVIPGSHLLVNAIRGPRIPQLSYQYDEPLRLAKGKTIPVKAGTAIIYHHGLIHFSPENKTAQFRPAINLSMVPKDAEVVHYCMPEGSDMIEKYQVNDNSFFIHYNNFKRPQKGNLLNTLAVDSVPLIDERINKWINELSWFGRIKKRLSA
ncbi:MAG: hypothetical protein JWO06_1428 [Bacteroidota bacterium]|nr:hypothetical protein [Bacteroidota bacterium]